jgi:hypothetical protein
MLIFLNNALPNIGIYFFLIFKIDPAFFLSLYFKILIRLLLNLGKTVHGSGATVPANPSPSPNLLDVFGGKEK